MSLHAAPYWDEIAAQWNQSRLHQLWRCHSDAVNSRLLNEWLPVHRVQRLLKTDLFDEACSEGLFPLLKDHADTVYGIDMSLCAVPAARPHYPRLASAASDVRILPFCDGAFDTIVSNSTLDHFDELFQIEVALRELSRVLRPGGELILTLDNFANPLIALRNVSPFKLLQWLGLTPYYVGATCAMPRLKSFVERAGLEVTDSRTILHCPRVLCVAVAKWFEHHGSARGQSRYLSAMMGFERLAAWPTRHLTGHFIAIKATKPQKGRRP